MDPTLIFFAALAGFICYRLYTVLGTRGGHEPEEQERAPLRRVEEVANDVAEPALIEQENLPAWMVTVREVWPDFDEKQFLSGAKAAYEMIVEAFAGGNIASVKPYLDPGVYKAFENAVSARHAAQQKSELQFVGIDKAEVVSAETDKGFVKIVVYFTSDQIRVLRDQKDEIIDGDPNRIDLVRDQWTFTRAMSSSDPNWILTATGGAAPAAE